VTLADVKRETARRDYIREPSGELTRRDVLAREWHIVQFAKNGVRKHASLSSSNAQGADELAEDRRQMAEGVGFAQILLDLTASFAPLNRVIKHY
jgi:hypothetical protein